MPGRKDELFNPANLLNLYPISTPTNLLTVSHYNSKDFLNLMQQLRTSPNIKNKCP